MPDAWVPGFALTLLFSLLCSSQPVSPNEVVFKCGSVNCTRGFRCCDSGCCPKKNVWDPSNDTFRILFILFMVMIPLLCICGFVRRFCPKCREPEQNRRPSHQIPPEPPSIAPLETIWVTTLDPPPPYSQVVQKPVPTEPPPPYSLRPEEPADQMRGTDSQAF
ncbi:transmembrane protein 92 [Peromyscus eremicus]|uniref:transmembrane protein 92 n=1 Tax=Peromyscus eremicus TaxID=42410 RepID=UPI0027DBFEAE|nr:transmembrane protein 92 [Peromyscus eremicus]